MECFARFGRQIARSVAGRLEKEDLTRSSEAGAAFNAAIGVRKLSQEVRESLYHRCIQFLRSSEHVDERLKLRLTQGFFFAELLCIHGAPFDPLSAQAFNGAVFYMDTNVIIMGLLVSDTRAALFDEMLRLARSLGIQLRVTRATIDETRGVVARRRAELEKYTERIPEELTEITQDTFLSAFKDARERNLELTPEQFLAPFETLTRVLEVEWQIVIDDRNEDEILQDRKFPRIETIMQEEVGASRPYPKSEHVLHHDVSLYALVEDERPKNPKTWILTADRSLVRAASRILSENAPPAAAAAAAAASSSSRSPAASSNAGLPFCFSLAGFLQSISPFTATSGEEDSLADIFSALVSEYLSLSEDLFDMREMLLLMEMHEDVMTTPAEELVPALDYVKRRVLEGRQYKIEDLPKVALELKKFLSKSVEERQKELEREAERKAEEIRKEQQARIDAEKAASLREKENTDLRDRLSFLDTEGRKKAQEISELSETLEREKELRRKQEREQLEQRERERNQAIAARWRDRMLIAFAIAAALWIFDDNIIKALINLGLDPTRWTPALQTVLSGLSALIFCLPALIYIRHISWRSQAKILFFALIVVLAFSFSRLLSDEYAARVASFIEIAMGVSGVAYLIVSRDQKGSNDW